MKLAVEEQRKINRLLKNFQINIGSASLNIWDTFDGHMRGLAHPPQRDFKWGQKIESFSYLK